MASMGDISLRAFRDAGLFLSGFRTCFGLLLFSKLGQQSFKV